LGCLDGRPIEFVPGQWVNLHVPTGAARDKRAYSIASAPDAARPNEFEVAVTRVADGQVSQALHALAEGAILEIDGPYGFFTRQGLEHEPALFVGTGTGICPLRAMIQAELRHSTEGPALRLLLGCRSQADILYRAELEALAERYARFSFEATLSRPDPSWSGRTGYVQSQLASLIDVQRRPHVYACGLSPMIDAVRKTLKSELGYDRKLIHSERYD
jgi:CDP-4-dehydro-6-deoxyglucose reductase, E3